jgi:flagellum-specific peptidoglycan hydrolase FlgJ
MGVFTGTIKATDLTRLWELIQQVVSAVEQAYTQTKDMSSEEKKTAAKSLILKQINAPFWKRWILSFVLDYVIDATVSWRNKIYGRFWGTDEPLSGYADAMETEPEPPKLESQSEGKIAAASIAVDGVSAASVLSAIKAHNKTHADRRVNELAAISQLALETGHFKSFRGFNLAGIKSTPGWEKVGGKVWSAGTSEYQGGKMVQTTGRFRAYDDLAHFLDDYSSLIHRCYPITVRNLDCLWLCLAGLYKGKYGAWATDPKYYDKLCAMVVRYAPRALGDNWQERLTTSYQLARQRGFPEAWMEKSVLKALG